MKQSFLWAWFKRLPCVGGLLALTAALSFAAEPATNKIDPLPVFQIDSADTAATNSGNLPFSSTNRQILLEIEQRKAADRVVTTNDEKIGAAVAYLLEQRHYLSHPIDKEISGKFLDRYLQMLDPARMFFFDSDIAQFEIYRDRLGALDLRGDLSPAYAIFARLLERVQQRVDYVGQLLATEKFEFTGEDRFKIDRKNADRPKNLADAQQLWNQYLRYEVLEEKLAEDPPEMIVSKIARRYATTLRSFKQFDDGDVLELYLTSLTSAYDPHSEYMGKSASDNFNITMSLKLYGIGAVLSSEDGYCTITSLVAGGPAKTSGQIKEHDRIIAVADHGTNTSVDVIDWKLNDVVGMIRGPKDVPVRLTIIPAANPSTRKEVTLVRDEIKLEDQAAKAQIIDIPIDGGKKRRIGIIDLPSFYAEFGGAGDQKTSASKDVEILLAKLKQASVEGLILDLRRNGGGSLTEAIELTGLFIKDGPVVQAKGPRAAPVAYADPDPSIAYDGPMVVLTSRFSASASEILAGALQDYGRALIVGDSSTHGKGTVQEVRQLDDLITAPNPGEVKMTIRTFYRPSGLSTQLKGVIPDIILPSVDNFMEVGEASLPNALPFDTIPSARFDKFNWVAPYVVQLSKLSKSRTDVDKDFQYVADDIEQFKKTLADRTVSLNESQRLAEKKENAAKTKMRQDELKSRPPSNETVYSISLKAAQLPGLPQPDDLKPKPATNNVAQAASGAVDANATKPDAASDDVVVDADLKETKRILADFIGLSAAAQTASTPTAKTTP